MSIIIGENAPDFTMTANNGRIVSLKGQAGKPFVLYFYPKADTPGCTTEACAFEESIPKFKNIAVIGVSPDAMPSIEKFAKKYNLTFPLASDPDHSVAEAFGVWVEKSMYGKTYMGIERSTFLIDAKGRIARAWRKIKVDGHAAEVMTAAALRWHPNKKFAVLFFKKNKRFLKKEAKIFIHLPPPAKPAL